MPLLSLLARSQCLPTTRSQSFDFLSEVLAYCFDDSNHQNTLYYCLLLLSYCLLFKVIISNDHFAGIVLILAGQCVSAIQMIVEESFLKKKNFHPLQVSSLLDKKIEMEYFIDDLHVLFLFFCVFSLVYPKCITVC